MNYLLHLVVYSVLFLVLGCETAQKNRTDSYVPGTQQCITDSDPSCVGQATAGVQAPVPEMSNLSSIKRTIMGRCEMVVAGERDPKPCQNIKLVVHSMRDNEVREAVIDGYNFRIQDLNKEDYNLEATSSQYEVFTDTKAMQPGQKVKIRIRVKPRN